MPEPLKAWWWNGKPNYGDVLNPYILQHVSGRPVEHAGTKRAEVFAIGSILQVVRKRIVDGGDPAYVWGSGMMHPMKRDFAGQVAFTLVRGPLTATTLMLDDLPHGDPGLLVGEALGIGEVKKTHRYGLIPHWMHTERDEVRQLLDALPGSCLIDMRSEDVHATTEAIASCEMILSSGLHGLIVADALGVPNLWVDSGRIGDTTPFKFFDYALSVGRPMQRPHTFESLIANGVPDPDTSYFANLPAMKETIKSTFPSELCA
ncbi:MAG: polysaccharide pyruvyl transferase family protein [Pseudomonadota bacterium]